MDALETMIVMILTSDADGMVGTYFAWVERWITKAGADAATYSGCADHTRGEVQLVDQ